MKEYRTQSCRNYRLWDTWLLAANVQIVDFKKLYCRKIPYLYIHPLTKKYAQDNDFQYNEYYNKGTTKEIGGEIRSLIKKKIGVKIGIHCLTSEKEYATIKNIFCLHHGWLHCARRWITIAELQWKIPKLIIKSFAKTRAMSDINVSEQRCESPKDNRFTRLIRVGKSRLTHENVQPLPYFVQDLSFSFCEDKKNHARSDTNNVFSHYE